MNHRTILQLTLSIAGLLPVFGASFAQEISTECPGAETRARCQPEQVTICWVTEDSSSEGCLTPPDGLTGTSLDLWLLSYILDDTITVTDESIASYQEIIRKGKWERGTRRVAFSLPAGWKGTRGKSE